MTRNADASGPKTGAANLWHLLKRMKTPGRPQAVRANLNLERVSKILNMQFRHLFRQNCVVKPRFASSKPSVFRLVLTKNLLELAHPCF